MFFNFQTSYTEFIHHWHAKFWWKDYKYIRLPIPTRLLWAHCVHIVWTLSNLGRVSYSICSVCLDSLYINTISADRTWNKMPKCFFFTNLPRRWSLFFPLSSIMDLQCDVTARGKIPCHYYIYLLRKFYRLAEIRIWKLLLITVKGEFDRKQYRAEV